jgi:hypothetical protein
MKKQPIIRSFLIFFFSATASLSINTIYAQDSKQAAENVKELAIKKMVDSQQFVFVAETALPTGGSSKMLTSDYDLKIKKDTIVAYLPYFGRAYNAGYGSTDGGIDFTSINFKYTKEDAKKGGWNISIEPKDTKDPSQKLSLYISKDGYGSLQVSSNNRQNISFNGYVREIKRK